MFDRRGANARPCGVEQKWGTRELVVLLVLVIYVCLLVVTGAPLPLAFACVVATVGLARCSRTVPARRA